MNNKLRWKASFTVEAAVIVPLVTMILILIVYLGFYLHDEVTIKAKLRELADQGAEYVMYGISPINSNISDSYTRGLFHLYTDIEEKENAIQEYGVWSFEEGLYLAQLQNIQVEINGSELMINADITYNLRNNKLFRLFSITPIHSSYQISESVLTREEKTRIFEVTIRTGENIKGIKEALNKLTELLTKVRK